MCSSEHWDTRTLDEKIDKQLYLQTALSRKPEEVIKKELEESKTKNQLVSVTKSPDPDVTKSPDPDVTRNAGILSNRA